MNILGIGPLELILVLLVVLLVLGPKDIVSTGKKLGKFLSNLRKSELWNSVTRVSKKVQDLPATLIREAELEDMKEEMNLDMAELKSLSEELKINNLNRIVEERKSRIETALREFDTQAVDAPPDKAAATNNPDRSPKKIHLKAIN